eukprot:TRINITY_DN3211_c0_g3_i1.p1 TRINITY_DN3211_c0_g3~~TRINITY_DN3211_c0_g3_i1.p1  ORF type:complete len:354 (+),score=48.98 TRINITY_DN3211_c0_g3_i1:885-1946(+)
MELQELKQEFEALNSEIVELEAEIESLVQEQRAKLYKANEVWGQSYAQERNRLIERFNQDMAALDLADKVRREEIESEKRSTEHVETTLKNIVLKKRQRLTELYAEMLRFGGEGDVSALKSTDEYERLGKKLRLGGEPSESIEGIMKMRAGWVEGNSRWVTSEAPSWDAIQHLTEKEWQKLEDLAPAGKKQVVHSIRNAHDEYQKIKPDFPGGCFIKDDISMSDFLDTVRPGFGAKYGPLFSAVAKYASNIIYIGSGIVNFATNIHPVHRPLIIQAYQKRFWKPVYADNLAFYNEVAEADPIYLYFAEVLVDAGFGSAAALKAWNGQPVEGVENSRLCKLCEFFKQKYPDVSS